MNQAIISLKPRYVELVLSGRKTVELRNRLVRMKAGTNIWLYATRPVGGIVALAKLELVVHACPTEIWCRFGKEICIDRNNFDSYIENRERVSALKLTSVRKLNRSVTLDLIRHSVRNFHPPQFYAHLSLDDRLSNTLNSFLQFGYSSIPDMAGITDTP